MVANPILPPDEAPWSYLRLHPARVPQFLEKLSSIEAEVLNSQSVKAEILRDSRGKDTHESEPEILNPQFSSLISFVPRAFVHQSTVFSLSKGDKDPQAQSVITPIGLVFLQGETSQTKRFLQEFFPNLHLVKDRATGHTAVITAQQMSPFKLAVELAPPNHQLPQSSYKLLLRPHPHTHPLRHPPRPNRLLRPLPQGPQARCRPRRHDHRFWWHPQRDL